MLNDGRIITGGKRLNQTEKKFKVSVITVVRNGELIIENTIKSIISQNYDDFEYIIVDGGSTDGTLGIISRYNNDIDFWISKRDNGIYDAMNLGINLSRGEWLNFMNAGDMFATETVLKTIFNSDLVFNNNCSFIYSDTYLFKSNLKDGKIFRINESSSEKRRLIHQSVLYKKELHLSYGYYLVKKGLMASDYLFFKIIPDNLLFKTTTIIAKYDISGISNKISSIRQKIQIDFLFNEMSIYKFLIYIILYPYYRNFKLKIKNFTYKFSFISHE